MSSAWTLPGPLQPKTAAPHEPILPWGPVGPLLLPMKSIPLLLALFVLGLPLSASAADPVAKGELATVTFVEKLYQAHDSEKGPFADVTKAGLDQWFSPSLSAVLLKALTQSDEAIIDFDPLYYAQENGVQVSVTFPPLFAMLSGLAGRW